MTSVLFQRWSVLPACDKARLHDLALCSGRQGKAKNGNRWTNKHLALKLNLTVGWNTLADMAMPSRRTVNRSLPKKYCLVGVQPGDTCFSDFDITVSGDDLSLTTAIDLMFVNGEHILVGNANCIPTVKHGPPVQYIINQPSDAPDPESVPKATNVLLHVIHTPVPDAPVKTIHIAPHDGLCFEDYIRILHEIEVTVPVANISYDNFSCQMQLKWGVLRPWTTGEDNYLRSLVNSAGVGQLEFAAAAALNLVRPVSIVMQRMAQVRSADGVGVEVGGVLGIPYPFRVSTSACSGKSLGVAPEWRHSLRLLVKHFRDKRNKLICWEFKLTRRCVTYFDVYRLYSEFSFEDCPIRYQVIDQTDSTLKNERAFELHRFAVVEKLITSVYGSLSTAVHLFVGSTYLYIFKPDKPISNLSKIVLAQFVALSIITQRLMVIKTDGFNLKKHSYTTATSNALLMDVGGFILLVTRGNGKGAVTAGLLGEWHNECLNSKLRCPGSQQFTSGVSLKDVLRRVVQVEAVDGVQHAQSKWDSRAITTGKEPELSQVQVYCALQLAWDLWVSLGEPLGYGDLLKSYGSYTKLYTEHLRCTKPPISSVVSYKDLMKCIMDAADVPEIVRRSYNLKEVMQSFVHELMPFLRCLNVLHDVSKHASQSRPLQQKAVGRFADADSSDENDGLTVGGVNVNQFVAIHFNDTLRQQNRNLLDRYKYQGSLRATTLWKVAADTDDDDVIVVGSTWVMLFEVESKNGKGKKSKKSVQLGLYCGLVCSLVASLPGGKGKRSYAAVQRDDDTAIYYCSPYALVKVIEGRGDSRSVELETVVDEVPTLFDVAGRGTGHAFDMDSSDEDEEQEQVVSGASNLKFQVDVQWSGTKGKVMSDCSRLRILKLYDTLNID